LPIALRRFLQIGWHLENADLNCQNVVVIQAEIHSSHASETREEQSGSHEKNDGQRHFRNHECSAKPLSAGSGSSHSFALMQRTPDGGTREMQDWRQTEGYACDYRSSGRRRKHPEIDTNVGGARHLSRYGRPQDLDTPPGHRYAECRSGQGQDKTLQQQHT
jgi:hypothetical protein